MEPVKLILILAAQSPNVESVGRYNSSLIKTISTEFPYCKGIIKFGFPITPLLPSGKLWDIK